MDEARAKKKLDELKSRKKGNYFSYKPGKNYLRVLPNWTMDMNADFYYETQFHRNLGPNKDKKEACLIAEGQPACPVCKACKDLWDTKDAENSELAKSMRASTRVYYNVIDLNDKAKGPQVMISGVDVLEQILAWCTNPKYGDVTDPVKGRNLELIMTEGKNTRSGFNEYDVQPDPDRTPIEEPTWLDNMTDLKSFVKPLSYEALDALVWGKEEGEQAPKPAPTPAPAPSAAAPTQTGKPCFGKYDSEDAECQTCKKEDACKDEKAKRKAMMSKPAETPAPAPAPEAPKAEPPKAEPPKPEPPKPEQPKEPKKGPAEEKNITELLAKIDEKRKKRA